jgi:hypothetical protein
MIRHPYQRQIYLRIIDVTYIKLIFIICFKINTILLHNILFRDYVIEKLQPITQNKINTYCKCFTNHCYIIYVTIDFWKEVCKFKCIILYYSV